MAHRSCPEDFPSLAWKILLGTLAAGVLVFALFQQPWVPIEFSDPETGVLIAMPVPAKDLELPSDLPAEKPIEVPLAEPELSDELPAPPFAQTAELPAEPGPTKPTVVYQLPEAFEVPASEAGVCWSFVIPTGVQRELFLIDAELRPGNKNLVQRMILSYDSEGSARQQDQQTPKPGFASPGFVPKRSQILKDWSPETPAKPALEDSHRRIPAGADLVLTIEYGPSAVAVKDPWSMHLSLGR